MSNEEASQPKQEIIIVGTLSGGVRSARRDIVERTLDVSQVRENFSRFLEGLKTLISDAVPSVGAYELDEVQFNAEISADGEFKLLGAGVGLEATTGVSFTMRRKAMKTE
jgi:hypothetical protein